MKKIFSFLFLAITMVAQAQEKFDEILLTNGVEYIGKVREITEKEVKFSHKGETLVYTITKSQIFRIAFASGRTEIFTQVSNGNENNVVDEKVMYNKNMIAVLPFRYLSNKAFAGWDEMAYKIQEEAYAQSLINLPRYSFQSPAVTNAILLKKGINPQQLRAYTMDEIANLLGVGMVMVGEVNLRSTGFSQASTQTVFQNNNKPVKPSGFFNSNTTVINNRRVVENFATNVTLRIYNESGATMFVRSKESFWSTPDAYKITLNYLLKRTGL